MNVQLVASCLGLSLTICDIYTTRKEEKALVWSSPPRFTTVKALYLLSRYFGLACQLHHVSLSAYWKYRYDPIPPRHACASDLAHKIFEHHSLLTILHIILMLRVYALYNKSLKILLLLIIIFASRLFAAIWNFIEYWDIYTVQFSYICFPNESVVLKPGMTVYALAEALFQIVIHTLVSKKTWTLPSTWSKTPTLTSIVTKDGFYVFFAVYVATVAAVVSTYKRGPALLFFHPLFVFMIPYACSRIIMRLQRFGDERGSQGQEDPVFSTVGSPWEVRTFPSRNEA